MAGKVDDDATFACIIHVLVMLGHGVSTWKHIVMYIGGDAASSKGCNTVACCSCASLP
jgi:hypothetical protein